jgi:O-antigen/teichoic acid export membrane protein
MAIVSMVVVVISGGVTRYILREISENPSPENSKQFYLDISTISFVLLLISFFAFILRQNLFIFFIPLIVNIALVSGLLRGEGYLVAGNVESQALRPTLLISFLLILHEYFDIYESTLFALLVGMLLINGVYFAKKNWSRLTAVTARKYNIKSLLALTIFALVETAYLNLDILIISLITNTEMAAEYKVAILVRTLVLLPLSVALMTYPHLIAAKLDTTRIERQYKYIVYLMSITGLVVNFMFGESLFAHIFGSQYSNVSSIIWPFLLMAMLIAFIGFPVERLIVLGKEKWVMVFSMSALVVHCLVIYALLPSYGLQIATISSGLSYFMIYFFANLYLKNEKYCRP